MDSKMYPTGSGSPHFTKWVDGILKFFVRSTGLEFFHLDPANRRVTGPGLGRTERFRVTTAEINAGKTLLPALAGYKYRVHDISMIAVGGAAGATTTVDVLGTQAASSVKLLAVAIAALTQSAVVRAGASNATVLADGASFASCDANTAITAGKTGASLTTATHIDIALTYEVIPA